MKNLFAILSVALFSVFANTAIAAEAPNLVLKRGGVDWITLTKEGAAVMVSSKASSITLTRAGAGFAITAKSGPHRVKYEDGKHKVYGPNGALILKIKITQDKIKILRSEDDPEPWSIKSKSGSADLKVKRSETELGKIAFHPEKSLIKVKDMTGSEVCSMTSTAIMVSPAVCLMNGLPEESALMAFALLNAIAE
ncbi:MAG: hypothetical protein HQK86_14645 [Nitrospinae bacterium]|nr:hypothetical protein [Nitrospinota bacterium]MBF0633440.1 hypothetical protein [Nitrospinota bacterium]